MAANNTTTTPGGVGGGAAGSEGGEGEGAVTGRQGRQRRVRTLQSPLSSIVAAGCTDGTVLLLRYADLRVTGIRYTLPIQIHTVWSSC